jgi:hypothetical protein
MCSQAIVAGAIRTRTSSLRIRRQNIGATASVTLRNEIIDEVEKPDSPYRSLRLRDWVDANCISFSISECRAAAPGPVRRGFQARV